MTKPLIKWAGGKRQLLSHLLDRVPGSWETYFQPFIGGGALFVELAGQERLQKAVIGDLNPELVNLYSIVRDRPDALAGELKGDEFQNSESAFCDLRAEFNSLINTKKKPVRRAALLVYLNKHSYNGLWRVNSKGHYNVPFGRHARLSLPSHDTICRFSILLQNVKLARGDFAAILRSAGDGDFVYFDPPYHPVSKTANFTDYTMNGFDFSEQERLARTFSRLSDLGASLMLSNSDAPEIVDLYRDYHIAKVPAKRFINCNGMRRNGASELIITNYPL